MSWASFFSPEVPKGPRVDKKTSPFLFFLQIRPRAKFAKSKTRSGGRPKVCRILVVTYQISPGARGCRLARPKAKISSFGRFSEKKIEQRFRRPHGIGFPTVISTAFSQGKGSVMTIEGEQLSLG